VNIIIEARALQLYPLGTGGFHGGTELYVKRLARGLAERGHHVDVVTADLERREQRGPTEWWHGPENFPHYADCVVAVHNLAHINEYSADLLILAPNGVDPWIGNQGEMAQGIDAVACFSQAHVDLLCEARPTIDRAICHVTGLGVDLDDFKNGTGLYRLNTLVIDKVPGRMLYANSPTNGLWHVLDIFDHVKRAIPEATLHIAYDFDRQFEQYRWVPSAMAQALWDCKRRIETTPGVVNLGALSREDLVREQLACQVHVMPQDSENVSTTIHGLTALECAAAGAALVLSDCDGYSEIFGDGATLLPLPGTYLPQIERRYDAQDWAEAVITLMRDPEAWSEASKKARTLAERHTWDAMAAKFDAMLTWAEARCRVAP
jgi:glycosyltransferase involved in cell wall biosynthesis